MPTITIIMACYNAAPFLKLALNSVFSQQFTDYELLVVDDGSTDQTDAILLQNQKNNRQFRILQNTQNQGLANSLNRAIEATDSEYIARFDADDIMYPERLQAQYDYMKNHNIGLLGSFVKTFGYGRKKLIHYPQQDAAIRLQLLFQTSFAHPAVMYKRSALGTLRYDPTKRYAEDYALWVKMSPFIKMANIPKPLLWYRIHQKQISNNKLMQNHDAGKIRLEALRQISLPTTPTEEQLHKRLRVSTPYQTTDELLMTEQWLIKLAKHLNTPLAYQILQHEWYLCCIRAAHFGPWTWRYYIQSVLTQQNSNSQLKNMQLKTLCLMRIKYQSKAYQLLNTI